ncbi:flagellar type III secretion system pore protein FliP [uncultured Paludibaculum sp.]|uniref:flagellar type III secretion system pore protein FliP n=1 Tax=uncultured Paludibaculum sp. TaxID=1765020 RepID=UPI002AAC216C|nr:flagellar type III secretion system pore protein FliP [uncultured Paludibaculum sp.]
MLLPLLALPLSGAPVAPAVGMPWGVAKGGEPLTVPLQILVVLTALTLLPAVFVSLTPFLRITVVLHFLRQALGTQTAPSNQVLIGLALFLSLLIVRPVIVESYETAWQPMEQGRLSRSEAWDRGTRPVKTFLLKFVREKDIALMLEITKTSPPRSAADLDLGILAPAYVLSELKTGFQIGAVLFLPFLIIDIVIASVTLSIGMVQLPPVMISAPFKILLFVLVDGWNLVVGSLMRSFL